jgi:ribosomal protein S18 acetylase RimI-like enzyme
MVQIIPAISPDSIATVRKLFREYENFLGVDLRFQDFETELAALPGKYAPPRGTILLARVEENTAGCIALRKWEMDTCEMKRLYIRPQYRGQGIGRLLAGRMIDVAVDRGYSVMVLDTLDHLNGAMRLYRSLGFKERKPYYHNPLPGVTYWELDLKTVKKDMPGRSKSKKTKG